MRYEFKTKLTPEEAIERAIQFFGAAPGGLGLEVQPAGDPCRVTLVGGGGHVALAASVVEGKTSVEVETREWDPQVKQFMGKFAG